MPTTTYDSGGAGSLPGGGSPDYSVLGTWEAATDVDISGIGIVTLECYDSQVHSDAVNVAGATGLDSTHYRQIKSAPGCATPWEGKEGTGANFTSTGTTFTIGENYARVLDLYVESILNSAGVGYAIYVGSSKTKIKIINVVFHAENLGAGVARGLGSIFSTETLAYNCIAIDCKSDAFYLGNLFPANSGFVICCTAVGSGGYGFNPTSTAGVCVAWSCYASDNSGGDFRETNWDAPSGWNSSKDTSSDLNGTAGNNYKNSNDLITGGELDSDYLPTEHITWSGGAADNAGRNPYNDLTATYDFDDFFKNDTGGEAISKKDIRGIDRPTPDTADTGWDVGAAEYFDSILTLTPDECVIVLACDSPPLVASTLTPNECVIDLACDSPALINTTLTPNECVIVLACDSPTLGVSLIPDTCIIGLVCDSPALLGSVAPDTCIIGLVCDSPGTANLIIDWSISSVAEKTLNAAFTFIIGFVGAIDGQICQLALLQDAVGGRTVGFPANVRAGTDIPLPLVLSAADKTDYVSFVYRESLNIYDIIFFKKGF